MQNGETKKNRIMTKGDVLLLLLFVCAGAALFLLVHVTSSAGAYVYIYEDGEVIEMLSLSEDGEFPIHTAAGNNTVTIKDGTVSVTEADCPDKICVKQGTIQNDKETIICLPHKLVVEVRKKQGGEKP